MSLMLLLFSGIVILGQSLFSEIEQYQTIPPNPEIVENVANQEEAVVMVVGYMPASRTIEPYGSMGYTIRATEGTGFVVSTDGKVLTNKHVVENEDQKYRIITSSGKRYDAVDILKDPENDIAIVKVDPNQHPESKLTKVTLGDSDSVDTGEAVVAVRDDPGEILPTKTAGSVLNVGQTIYASSHQSRRRMSERLEDMVQTNIALIPGNSGSPLFDEEGSVIGINTATAASGESISYAIPINLAKEFLGTVE